MRPRALLISGTEDRHKEMQSEFADYLRGIGCFVEHVRVSYNPLAPLPLLKRIVRELHADQAFLLAFNGHGSRYGWGDRGLFLTPYLLIAPILADVPGTLFVMNDTCFGARFIPYLQRARRPEDTGFIAPWDSDGEAYATVIRDALQFWPEGKATDEAISEHIVCTDEGDRSVPVQQRWGARLDHLFFPA